MLLAFQLLVVRGVEPALADPWLTAPVDEQHLAVRAWQEEGTAEVAWLQVRPSLPLVPDTQWSTGRVLTGPDGTTHTESLSVCPQADDDAVRARVEWDGVDLMVAVPRGRATASGRSDDGTLWLLRSARVDSAEAATALFGAWTPPTPRRAARRAARSLARR
jgi:hypothetical protein